MLARNYAIAAVPICSPDIMPHGRSPLVLITRPEDTARTLAKTLEAKGYNTVVEPLLHIEPLGPMAPLAPDVQAIILTSTRAVPALHDDARQLPIYAVGKATAAAARDAGCMQVIEGDGDGKALAGRIARTCRPDEGSLLHLGGEIIRDDLHRQLDRLDFTLRREIVYRAHAKTELSRTLRDLWLGRQITAVLLFSPRTAEILVRLLRDHNLAGHVDRTVAICVSEAAAAPCRMIDWRAICLAPRPNRDALLRTLEGSIGIC